MTGTATNGAPKLNFPSVPPCGPPYSNGTGVSGTGTWKYTPSTGSLTMSGSVTLAAGKYCFSSIKESSHGILKVDGPVVVYVTGEVDLTGDGINNSGRQSAHARDEAVAMGITINGLPILTEVPWLDDYFRDNVIGGVGAFVIPAPDFDAFAAAIYNKLIREIAGDAWPAMLAEGEAATATALTRAEQR